MKVFLIAFFLTIFFTQTAQANEPELEPGQEHEHESVFNPEMEDFWIKNSIQLENAFPQTRWQECNYKITGNFSGYACNNRRLVSVTMKNFLSNEMEKCAESALRRVGINGRIRDSHIEHVGIQGDRNHSPRSLHSESRAIDVRSFSFELNNSRTRRFVFASSSSQPFFREFRKCWGQRVKSRLGCPYISNRPDRTGSIGKEDSNHQNHLHLSVPYCVNGRYSSRYFRR
jgi:hypothetical protein